MKHLKQFSILFLSLLISYSCSNDDDGGPGTTSDPDPFVVAFVSGSTNLTTFDTQSTVDLTYSNATTETGTVSIDISEINAVYGVDYTTTPAAINNIITLNINNDESSNSFVFNKLNPTIDEEAVVDFEITDIDYPGGTIQGTSTFQFNNSASLGGGLFPEVGGPNQPNQVFVDLSNNLFTTAGRDSWDLGFYSGNEFRVVINGSVYMMAEQLSATDIDAVSSSDAEVISLQGQMNIGQPGANNYVDDVTGDIMATAIDEISDNDSENPVYLINLGFEVGTDTPDTGSVDISDDPRGFIKIRVLRDGNDYVLQYADLDDTTHDEVTISKLAGFNFTFFSMNTEQIADVQPETEKWDLCFTVFSNVIDFGAGPGAYGFADFVIHNRLGDVQAYSVDGLTITYDDFQASNIDANSFSANQNIIGSGWRSVFSGSVTPDIFYIINDTAGNTYKLRFLALTNPDGERGFPQIEYELL